jgi:hypothetical protein
MDDTPIVNFTTLTIGLLALVGTVMVLVGLWLLAVGRVSLSATPSEPVLEAEVPNVVTVKTRMPALGLMVLGMISILGATQLDRQAKETEREQEARRWFVVVGHARAIDTDSVPKAHLALLTHHATLSPLDDGTIRGDMRTGSGRFELRIRAVGRKKPDVTVAIGEPPIGGSLKLPDIDLDELLGEIVVEKPAPAPTPMQPLPNRTATPAFGSGKP